jgi:glycerophosphoryl diester phosphodiesterase
MLRRTVIALASLGAFVVLGAAPAHAAGDDASAGVDPARCRPGGPTVIGHRGAWGYRPEHTLAAYRLGIDLGADVVEQDLISTRDGVLIARNSNELSSSTDVASHPEFAARRTTKTVDGVAYTGWFSEDLTLAEIKTLRATERTPDIRPGNVRYNGKFQVPTLQEVIDLVRAEGRRLHRRIGIYPETKRATYFRSIGLPLEERLIATLRRNGLNHRGADVPVYLQSFEPSSLQRLDRLSDLPVVQLVDAVGKPYDFVVAGDPRTFADLVTPAGLRWVHRYADIVAVNKDLIVPRDATGHLGSPTTLVDDAHRVGLGVHAWRFANENTFLPADFRRGTDPLAWGDHRAEYRLFYRLGIDGVLTDFPDAAVAARPRREDRDLGGKVLP